MYAIRVCGETTYIYNTGNKKLLLQKTKSVLTCHVKGSHNLPVLSMQPLRFLFCFIYVVVIADMRVAISSRVDMLLERIVRHLCTALY